MLHALTALAPGLMRLVDLAIRDDSARRVTEIGMTLAALDTMGLSVLFNRVGADMLGATVDSRYRTTARATAEDSQPSPHRDHLRPLASGIGVRDAPSCAVS